MNTAMTILLGILAAVIAEQLAATFPSLALKLVRWSAGRRYAGNPARAEVRAEELEALIEARPGGLLKITTALGFAAAAVWSAARRALGEHPVRTIARVVTITAQAVWYTYCALCFLIGGVIIFGLLVGLPVGIVASQVTGTLGPAIGVGAGIAAAAAWAICCCAAFVSVARDDGFRGEHGTEGGELLTAQSGRQPGTKTGTHTDGR
jgi:hypothetical protein